MSCNQENNYKIDCENKLAFRIAVRKKNEYKFVEKIIYFNIFCCSYRMGGNNCFTYMNLNSPTRNVYLKYLFSIRS